MADRMSDSLYSGNLRPPSSPKNAAARNLQDLLDSNLAAKQMRMGIAPDVRNTTPGLSTWDGALRALRRDATKIGEGIKTGFDNLGTDMRLPWGSPPEAYNAVTNAAMATMGLGYGPAVGKMAMGNLRPNPSQLNMFLGEGARTADKSVLKKAKAMEKKGATRNEIWEATAAAGQPWRKDGDGKWKFEVDDSSSRIAQKGEVSFGQLENVGAYTPKSRLGDNIWHQGLYDGYPKISEINTSLAKADYPSGSFHSTTMNEKPFRSDIQADGADLESIKSTLLHELQHAVQSREGFARGGSSTGPYQSGELDAVIAEIFDKIKLHPANKGESKTDLFQHARKLAQTPDMRYKIYKRLAGEAEARNVQTRKDMTMDQRRAKPPWKTLDVPEDELIFRK